MDDLLYNQNVWGEVSLVGNRYWMDKVCNKKPLRNPQIPPPCLRSTVKVARPLRATLPN